jgi:phosphoribosylglycinamide formyltransferase-1
MLNLGFLASHGGSNMQAIIDACADGRLNAKACCVISNNSDSGAIQKAIAQNIPHYHISLKHYSDDSKVTDAIIEKFSLHGVDTVILAGYMKKLDQKIVEHFNHRVLNIHPALLPKYGGQGMYGMKVHKAVIAAGEHFSGATIHLVDENYDKGRILSQIQVPVLNEDTAETLAERVLVAEHKVYTDTLIKIEQGEIVI